MPKSKEDIKADLEGILESVAATLVLSREVNVLREFNDRFNTAILDYANKLVKELPDSEEIKKKKAADLVVACGDYNRDLLSLDLLAEEIARILFYKHK